jgi:hypothetical protein
MTDKTRASIEALSFFEGDDMPEANEPTKWGEWAPFKRYEWAAVRALREGDTAEAQVLATLAHAAALDRIGFDVAEALE